MNRERRRVWAAVFLWWSGAFMAAGWYMDSANAAAVLLAVSAVLGGLALLAWPKDSDPIGAPVKTLFKYGFRGD